MVAGGTTMIEAASSRSPPPAYWQVQSKMREFLKAPGGAHGSLERQGLTGGLTLPHNSHRTIVIFACRIAVYGRWANPGRRHSREELNAPGDFLPLACRCAVLLYIEANREAVR